MTGDLSRIYLERLAQLLARSAAREWVRDYRVVTTATSTAGWPSFDAPAVLTGTGT